MTSKALGAIVTWLKSVPSDRTSAPERAPRAKREMGRAQFVIEHAPPAPPCFESVLDWVEYLKAAAEAQKGADGPLVLKKGEAVGINRAFNFCEDCTKPFMNLNKKRGTCKQGWLLDHQPPPPVVNVELDMSGDTPSLTSNTTPTPPLKAESLDFGHIAALRFT